MQKNAFSGFALAISAAILWGVSGTVGQFLFQERGINVEWLITVRMLISGILLLLFSKFAEKNALASIWRHKADAIQLIVFSIGGMLAVQYTYFAAIKHANAATATVLQYGGPIFIVIYLSIKKRTLPKPAEIFATLLAVFGTVMLVTRGNLTSLSVSALALCFGIGSAITLAVYTLQPAQLMTKFSASLVIGWGMLVGGLVFSLVRAPWEAVGIWDAKTFWGIAFIIVFGTLIAFYSYLSAVKMIGGQKASLLASAEPLSAALLSVLWLQVSFTTSEWIGSISIILTVFLLSKQSEPETKSLGGST